MLSFFNIKIEKWKFNKEYEVYVSNFGNFKDKNKRNIPINISNGGYCWIKTNFGLRPAHRLVMKTFKPIADDENLTVDHLNHNKRDNSIYNLEWISQEGNWLRATADYIPENLLKKIILNEKVENDSLKKEKETENNQSKVSPMVIIDIKSKENNYGYKLKRIKVNNKEMSFVDAIELLFSSFGDDVTTRKHIADVVYSKLKCKKAKNHQWHGFTFAKI